MSNALSEADRLVCTPFTDTFFCQAAFFLLDLLPALINVSIMSLRMRSLAKSLPH